MGNRDFRHHETKKSKKKAKKAVSVSIEQPVTVEVIKKGKKKRGEEPEE